MTADEGMRQTHPLKTFVVFVFFVVKSPFTRLSEGKGFIYHEEHEEHEERNGVWGVARRKSVRHPPLKTFVSSRSSW